MITTANLWHTIRAEVEAAAREEPMLASFLHLTVLRHDSLAHVLAFHLSSKLSSSTMDARALYETFLHVLQHHPDITRAVESDITLWRQERKTLAYFLQNRASEVFGVDIHPGAKFGCGIMFDHGTGIVIGETAVLGNNISLLHGVTLGGSGKESGDRHPKIGDGVMIGANASVLGNIRIGHCAKIGAGSVVVRDVEPQTTVVGVPAKAVGLSKNTPAADMDQSLLCDDFIYVI